MAKKEILEKKRFFTDTDFFVGLQGKIMALQDTIGRKEIVDKVCWLVPVQTSIFIFFIVSAVA